MQKLNINRDQGKKQETIVQTGLLVNISAIADLLYNVDGTYDMLERRVKELEVSDNMTKLLFGSQLKSNALEWLHPRSEYISISLDDLLSSLKEIFYHFENVFVAKRNFEAHTWRKEESFSEYLHQKVILGN